ncbi:MAG: hypothetical protein WDW36_000344 [Sanguina aurantia]
MYYVAVFCVIIPWFEYSVPGVTNIGVLSINTALALYCYVYCIYLDPGRVPDEWEPDSEDAPSVQEVKKKGGARFCQKCQRHKPPRSHHCRVCQRCILRMDHHCLWLNNCIGHANYKAFLMFLIYITAALVHVLGLLASHTLHALSHSQQHRVMRAGPQGKPVNLASGGFESVWVWAALQTIAFALALPLTIGLAMLLAWHIQLVLTNKTTIEFQEGVTASITGPRTGEEYEHPYDLGVYNNLHQILGRSHSTWLCPPCAPDPGGTQYPTQWEDHLAQH